MRLLGVFFCSAVAKLFLHDGVVVACPIFPHGVAKLILPGVAVQAPVGGCYRDHRSAMAFFRSGGILHARPTIGRIYRLPPGREPAAAHADCDF